MDPRLKIILYGNQDEELSLLMRLEKEKEYPEHCEIISEFGPIVSVRMLRRNLCRIYNSKKVKSLKAPSVVPANVAIEEVSSSEILEKRNDILDENTSNVVFGIIDFGFDWSFYD